LKEIKNNKVEVQKLVLAIKNQDKEAFAKLYDLFSGSLYGIAFKIVRSEEAAQDVLQDSFVKIWKNIQKYDEKQGTIFTWMLNITRNTGIDYLRKNKHQSNIEIQNAHHHVDDKNSLQSVINTDHIGVKDALSKLSEDQQLMIEYLYFKGYTQQEVSDELNMPLGSVKTKSRSALIKLRELFITIIFWIQWI